MAAAAPDANNNQVNVWMESFARSVATAIRPLMEVKYIDDFRNNASAGARGALHTAMVTLIEEHCNEELTRMGVATTDANAQAFRNIVQGFVMSEREIVLQQVHYVGRLTEPFRHLANLICREIASLRASSDSMSLQNAVRKVFGDKLMRYWGYRDETYDETDDETPSSFP